MGAGKDQGERLSPFFGKKGLRTPKNFNKGGVCKFVGT